MFTKAAWCELATLSQPDGWSDPVEIDYVIGDSTNYYEVPVFVMSEADCEISYTAISVPAEAWLTERPDGNGMQWWSDDYSFAD